MNKKGDITLFKEGLAAMRSVGTVSPSSVFLARALTPAIGKHDPEKVIVELGAGTGSVTEEIAKHLRPRDLLVSIEANKKLADICGKNIKKQEHGGAVHCVHAQAQHAGAVLHRYGAAVADDVVCTLPFRLLPGNETEEILHEVRRIVKPGGHFIFIRYIIAPTNKDVIKALPDFSVTKKKLVLRNIPPAEVVIMRKKISA